MQQWLILTAYSFFLALVRTVYDVRTGYSQRMKEIQQRMKSTEDPEELHGILVELNKLTLKRTILFIIFFLPIYYWFAGVGTIPTPFGDVHWLVWYVLSMLVASVVLGGVMRGIHREKAHAPR